VGLGLGFLSALFSPLLFTTVGPGPFVAAALPWAQTAATANNTVMQAHGNRLIGAFSF
jgi:hypothetical protein